MGEEDDEPDGTTAPALASSATIVAAKPCLGPSSDPARRAAALVATMAATTAAPPPLYHATVDWTQATMTVTTAATVEVDVMPHLSRTAEGGSFPGYYSALSNLGARYVRFSPWFAYPRVVVAELERADCDGRGSSWNTTHLDAIVSDFMQAVCGPDAADGKCANGLSVVPQLSTMPAWMYQPDGRTRRMPSDPWRYPSDSFNYYLVQGQRLTQFPACPAPTAAPSPH